MPGNRPLKGKSLLELPTSFVVVDIETTGLSPEENEIIEIAAIRVEDMAVVDRRAQLVRPSCSIDPYITELTGIDDAMVADAMPIADVIPRFRKFLGDSLIMGHNVNFDISFLYDASMAHLGEPISNDYIDTLRIARKLYPEARHSLQDLKHRFCLDSIRDHRALSDVLLTLEVYRNMRDYALETGINLKANKKARDRQLHAYYAAQQATEQEETHEAL